MTHKIARFDGWYAHAFNATRERMFYDGGKILYNHVITLRRECWSEKFKRNFLNLRDSL